MNEIDVQKQLNKQISIWEGLNNKSLRTNDWVAELASQVCALSRVCLQQQEEIDLLKSSIYYLRGGAAP